MILKQTSLFSDGYMKMPLFSKDGFVDYYPDFLNDKEAGTLFEQLKQQLPWQQRSIRLFGRQVMQPRLIYFAGDTNKGKIIYSYSGDSLSAHQWSVEIQQLAERISTLAKVPFNAVLINYYRDGNDSMGWHADDEPQLGHHPQIASLTLGAQRPFKLRHQQGETHSLILQSGSLLIMGGSLQHFWKHSLPKTRKINQGRINLTFRKIYQPGKI